MYAVVEFVGEDTTDIIPQKWFVDEGESSCFWPPKKATELAQKMVSPSPLWGKHDIRVLGKAGMNCYQAESSTMNPQLIMPY